MGFAQEIKDFIAASQAGVKLAGARDDADYKRIRTKYMQSQLDRATDPETIKLNKDLLRARSNRLNQGDLTAPYREELRRNMKMRNDELERQLKQPAVGGNPGLIDQGTRQNTPAVAGPQSDATGDDGPLEQTAALEPAVGDDAEFSASGGLAGSGYSMEAAHDAVRDGLTYLAKARGHDQPPPALPVQSASRGGKIQHFADGGSVEGEEDDEEDTLPAVGGEPGYGPGETDPEDDRIPQAALPAAGRSTAGAPSYPRAAAGRQAPGAISEDDMVALRKTVDPTGKMSEHERNMKVLGAVYSYHLQRGDAASAQRAAAGIVMNLQRASQAYAAHAAHAIERGDLDDAGRLAMKAYDNIPDGQSAKVVRDGDKFHISVVDDATGKVVKQDILSPEQLAAGAMHVASGQGFSDFVLNAAGMRSTAKKGEGGGKPVPALERTHAAELVTPVMEKEKDLDPDVKDDVENVAAQFATHNSITGRDAVAAAKDVFRFNDKGESAAKIAMNKEGGGTITTANGHVLRVPKDTIANIGLMQQKSQAKHLENMAKTKKNKDDSDKRAQQRSDALRAIGSHPAAQALAENPTY